MKKAFKYIISFAVLVFVLIVFWLNPDIKITSSILSPVLVDTETYYRLADNKTGEELEITLYEIIKDHKVLSYREVWDALRVLDEDPENQDNVITIFARQSIPKDDGSGRSEWNRWNREHVWPASKGFPRGTPAENSAAYTDLFNLYACIARVNMHKSNYDLDNCDKKYDVHYNPPFDVPSTLRVRVTSGNRAFEPPDEVKGKIARAMFYMALRYRGEDGEPNLVLVDTIPTQTVSSDYQWYGEFGKLSTFIEWHLTYPPSEREIHRNNLIYSNYQHNRNPFVDNPHWVTNIWRIDGDTYIAFLSSISN
jgi:endonuclease I